MPAGCANVKRTQTASPIFARAGHDRGGDLAGSGLLPDEVPIIDFALVILPQRSSLRAGQGEIAADTAPAIDITEPVAGEGLWTASSRPRLVGRYDQRARRVRHGAALGR